MAQTRKPLKKESTESTSDRTARDKTIAQIERHLERIPKKPTDT
jgi:hypothetical protein